LVAASGLKAAHDDSEMRMNVFLLEANLKPVADDCVEATKVGCRIPIHQVGWASFLGKAFLSPHSDCLRVPFR